MYEVKQSTALTLPFFAHDISGDAVTGLTDGSFTKRISKNGAAFGAMTVVISELENGWYSIPLSASHSDTLGLLTIVFTNAGAKQINLQFRVEAKLIDDLNDVAATDIVSSGAITTSGGSVSTVTTTTNLTTNNDKTGYAVVSTGLDLVLEGSTFIQAAVSGNWNALLTGATFNIATSAGRRLRQLETGIVLDSGTLDAATSNTADLETGVASTIDDFYNHNLLVITSLTGVGQVRVIVDYTGTGNIALISPPWVTTPDATSTYDVIIGYAHAETTSKTAHVGLAQAGATGTITLSTAASAMTDFYKNDVISIDSGTGEGQERIITAYNGTSKVATIEPDWLINPDSTSNYVVEEALCVADVFAMHHSQPAADNIKLDYDGTGFTRALSTIGTVTALTGHTPQTGDTFPLIGTPAADVSADIAAVKVNTTTDIPALIAALNDIAASDILTTALTESYAAVGVAPTLAQALFRIQQHLGEFGVIGTTLTVRKIDGTTTAMTFTLDDATDPTDTTRAT